MPRLFGTDGARGVANSELTCELAMKIGRAAAVVRAGAGKSRPKILIGMDPRISSQMLEAALTAGICSVGADVVLLAEIYAAREQNDIGISSQDLAREIPGAIYCSSLEKVTDTLASLAQPGDLILTVGAGDIFRAGEKLLERA